MRTEQIARDQSSHCFDALALRSIAVWVLGALNSGFTFVDYDWGTSFTLASLGHSMPVY